MLNACITSTISLRTRGSSSSSSSPFSPYGYSHCSIESHPFLHSSSRSSCCSCCCCCSNPMYRSQVSPNYCYNLYGFRQSSLIQWAPHRRLTGVSLDRCYYTRLPVSSVGSDCYCDGVCNFRVKNSGRVRKMGLGLSRRMLFDESAERYEVEAEAVLSLLAEDFDEIECSRPLKGKRKLLKKSAVEEMGNDEVRGKIMVKKKIVELGVLESEPRCEKRKPNGILRKKDGRRREEIAFREEKAENLAREGNRKERVDGVTNGRDRKNEEDEVWIRKSSQRVGEEKGREYILRKENVNVSSRRDDETEDLSRREEDREKVRRRDGSSCSSYYSFSSAGDYESENETELKEDGFSGDLSNSGVEIVHQKTMKEDQRYEARKEDRGRISTRKSTEKDFESDFRKKSEKKLTDISVEEVESSKKSLMKESNFSRASEINYERGSDYFDERKVKSLSEITKPTEERKQKLLQMGDEELRQSETRMKYKQFVGKKDTRVDEVRSSYGSQKGYTVKGEMSAKVKSPEKAVEHQAHQAAVGLSTKEDNYERDSCKISEVSESQDIDIRKTSISKQRLETSVKEEEYSTNVFTSTNVASKQQRDEQASFLGESSGTSQNLTSKNGKSILKRESEKLMKQQDNLNLVYGSSSESKQTLSQTHSKIDKTVNSRKESDEFIITQPLPYLPEKDATNEGGSTLASNDTFHGQTSKFVSPEDAIESAARLEKSSEHYHGEFVSQLRSEIVSSEIQREKQTPETKVLPKVHDLKQDGQPSESKGPSDEMWKEDEPSAQKLLKPEIQDNSIKPENAIVKRSGKSLWNIFADIVRLRWSPRLERKSSPNQSTSSEAWFSGHEADENEGTSITHDLSSRRQEEKTHFLVGQSSGSSTSEGYIKNGRINEPSSSSVLETSGIEVPEGKFGDTSSSISLPALRLRKFSSLRGGLEIKEVKEENPSESDVKMEKQESSVSEGEVKQKRLQRKDQIMKDRFDEWEEAYMLEAEQRKIDEMFMREALLEAKKAADNWEVPVGAVLVHNGKIIARGCNLVEEMRDSTAHAEIICIREASNVLRTWRLSETTLYITLEPCAMCAGAILQARIDTVVWGAPNKLLGADGSWIRLFPVGEGGNSDLDLTSKPPAPIHPFHPKIVVRRGVLSSECADAMQQFFKLRRKKDKKPDIATSPPSCLPITHRPSRFMAKMHDGFSLIFEVMSPPATPPPLPPPPVSAPVPDFVPAPSPEPAKHKKRHHKHKHHHSPAPAPALIIHSPPAPPTVQDSDDDTAFAPSPTFNLNGGVSRRTSMRVTVGIALATFLAVSSFCA
ncbi:tRNA-specific adenosine deaminase [Striga asiatica]|uniref:tRNA(adenine(34)) deaminase n=1 Tax=Striga asiatica TaxID=4170 RepID=A0A5A7QZD8_STRAF|nr:tRNA-specific adenosine deaminase [Striga asiatica]